jgi:hypothetical protein
MKIVAHRQAASHEELLRGYHRAHIERVKGLSAVRREPSRLPDSCPVPIRKVPHQPSRVYHSVLESAAPDCLTMMSGRNRYMLDSGLRRWAMELFGEAEQTR